MWVIKTKGSILHRIELKIIKCDAFVRALGRFSAAFFSLNTISSPWRAGLLLSRAHKSQFFHTQQTIHAHRVKMRTHGLALRLWLLLLKPSINCLGLEPPCEKIFSNTVKRGKVLESGSLQSTEDGALYPNGTFMKLADESYWTCPCLLGKNCIRICSEGILFMN